MFIDSAPKATPSKVSPGTGIQESTTASLSASQLVNSELSPKTIDFSAPELQSNDGFLSADALTAYRNAADELAAACGKDATVISLVFLVFSIDILRKLITNIFLLSPLCYPQ